MKQFVSCEGLPDIPPSLPPPPSVFALFHNFSTTNSHQLNTKQPFWFLKLNVSDEVIVGPLGHDALFTLTPSPPPSLSRSLTGLQLISPNTRHSPQSQDQLFAGMFCTKVFLLRYQHQQKPVFYHQTQCCQYLSAARVAGIVNLLELCDFREQQIQIIPSLEFEEINDLILLTNWKKGSWEHVLSAGSVKLNWNTFSGLVSKMECDHNERCHCGDWEPCGCQWLGHTDASRPTES